MIRIPLGIIFFLMVICGSKDAAAAIVDIFGDISREVSTQATGPINFYKINNMTIGNHKASTDTLTFSAIVAECMSSSTISEKWQLTIYLDKGRRLTKYYYGGEPISPETVAAGTKEMSTLAAANGGVSTATELTAPPGEAIQFENFEIKCSPTIDDEKPSKVRLRFFGGSDLKETFTTAWATLPNIRNLSLPGQGQALKFRFQPASKNP